MSKLPYVDNVAVSIYGASGCEYSLSCEHDGARYHVWLDDKCNPVAAGVEPVPFLYKNPLHAVGREDENWFPTRRLGVHTAFGKSMWEAMFGAACINNLFNKAHEAEIAARERVARAETDLRRLSAKQKAGPALYDALKKLTDWARDFTSPRDPNSPHEILIEATAALEQAKAFLAASH
ncbi:hypothetical protein GJ654_10300 [Rhodoblastus acidophilus]|uniref:Uncharacterized protein n=1 Tax=Rhodoblastus acidophilus TaxID=1074 RepID=A0A6N8DRD4_RHOAC|nr:hypothetical protein [Rhodoblastus acidophilus]MCW2275115.1 hypothetical protein [Rhodoblastus acidophilus]MTV31384.1 hypothetical protein [Rhodoblastus acidophilus]